jgi:hypothetical protein
MKASFVMGLSPDQTKEMEREFKEASLFRKRLSVLLAEKIQGRIKEATSKTEYESPSWAYKQADLVGYIRGMEDIISLLKD